MKEVLYLREKQRIFIKSHSKSTWNLEKNMKLETKRLYLRELTEKDFSALYDVLADSDIMQHYPYTFDESRVKG